MSQTQEEYEELYALKSKAPLPWLHEQGFSAIPCDCGGDDCVGWQMAYGDKRWHWPYVLAYGE